MIRVQPEPWATMVAHAQSTYPNECCGVMLGSIDDDNKVVEIAMNLENAYTGPQNEHYEVRLGVGHHGRPGGRLYTDHEY